MKILVMGAGAVGAYYGARLQASGEDIVFCARGEQLRALKEHGLEIKSAQGDLKLRVKATERPADFAPYDLILFAVKSYDTEAAAKQLEGCLARDGTLMTIQNGVENEEILCKHFPRDAVMGGNSRVGAEVVAPGKILHTALGKIELGALDGRESPHAQRSRRLCARAHADDRNGHRWTRRGREHERRARRTVFAGPGKESANHDDEAVDPAGPREGQAPRVRRHLRRRLEGRAPSRNQGARDRNRLHAPEAARQRTRVRRPLMRYDTAPHGPSMKGRSDDGIRHRSLRSTGADRHDNSEPA